MGIHCFSCAQNHTKDHHPFNAAHHCAPLTGTEKYKMWWKITPRGGRVIWLPDRPRGIFLRPPGELHMAAQLVAGKKRTGSNLHTKRDLQNFTSYLLESRPVDLQLGVAGAEILVLVFIEFAPFFAWSPAQERCFIFRFDFPQFRRNN